MTAEVISLESRRKPKPVPAQTVTLTDSEHYFCMKCDSDQFRMYAGGEVHCAKCGSLMNNLYIGENGR